MMRVGRTDPHEELGVEERQLDDLPQLPDLLPQPSDLRVPGEGGGRRKEEKENAEKEDEEREGEEEEEEEEYYVTSPGSSWLML